MNVWFYEEHKENLRISYRVKKVLAHKKTSYQELVVLDMENYGRTLVLDGAVQTTVRDEFIYHEMIAHVPLFTHPNPEKVLVIGGGDGGTVRETLKHKEVKEVHLVEIDPEVVAAAREYFPEISSGLINERVHIHYTDGIKFVAEKEAAFDVIIVDSSDPVGPAVGLFGAEFYANVARALKPDGLFVAQTESPWGNEDILPRIYAGIRASFPIVRMYLATVPTYPGWLWSFTLGSKKYDPLAVDVNRIPDLGFRYYTPELHRAAFVLPRFVSQLLESPAEPF
ncbi:MAG: spermidine synthase [Bacillota bacterium]|nr:spermidine synthase [Bacillota bacterium]MDK2856335.1 spermidine synthase [Bacillota bacterium]MDK2925100.1 spermidine synthase [Bacillota bacterium]